MHNIEDVLVDCCMGTRTLSLIEYIARFLHVSNVTLRLGSSSRSFVVDDAAEGDDGASALRRRRSDSEGPSLIGEGKPCSLHGWLGKPYNLLPMVLLIYYWSIENRDVRNEIDEAASVFPPFCITPANVPNIWRTDKLKQNCESVVGRFIQVSVHSISMNSNSEFGVS